MQCATTTRLLMRRSGFAVATVLMEDNIGIGDVEVDVNTVEKEEVPRRGLVWNDISEEQCQALWALSSYSYQIKYFAL